MSATPTDWETIIQDAPELEPAVRLALAAGDVEFPTLFEQLVAAVREQNADTGCEMTFDRLHGWLHGLSWFAMRLHHYVPDPEDREAIAPLISEISALGIALHRSRVEEIEHADLFGQLDCTGE